MSMQEHPICSSQGEKKVFTSRCQCKNILYVRNTIFLGLHIFCLYTGFRFVIYDTSLNRWSEWKHVLGKKRQKQRTEPWMKQRHHNIRILKGKSLLKRQTNICWKNWNAFSFSWESIITKNDLPLLFEAWQVTYMVEGLQDIRIDSPDNIRSKEENPNKLSSRNNPERSIHNDRESPQPETWITRAFLPITQQI